MTYYLVDINEDLNKHKSRIVYRYHNESTFYLSGYDLQAVRAANATVVQYRHLTADISDEDLIIMRLRGVVDTVNKNELSPGIMDVLNSWIIT